MKITSHDLFQWNEQKTEINDCFLTNEFWILQEWKEHEIDRDHDFNFDWNADLKLDMKHDFDHMHSKKLNEQIAKFFFWEFLM